MWFDKRKFGMGQPVGLLEVFRFPHTGKLTEWHWNGPVVLRKKQFVFNVNRSADLDYNRIQAFSRARIFVSEAFARMSLNGNFNQSNSVEININLRSLDSWHI